MTTASSCTVNGEHLPERDNTHTRPDSVIAATEESPTSKPPETIDLRDPRLAQFCRSAFLFPERASSASNQISIVDKEVYGRPSHPILFRVGNGGAGYTGVLKVLAETFIATHGDDFRIGWVTNHSRHSIVALLADIVQVALTYEPYIEDIAINQGLCKRVSRAFNDHFILAGPCSNPARLPFGGGILEAFQTLGDRGNEEQDLQSAAPVIFHTRGDGSATYSKEHNFWNCTSISNEGKSWYQTQHLPPYQALEAANRAQAYLLTDRATYLTTKRDGVIPSLQVFCEGGSKLLNPCSALVNVKVPKSPSQQKALAFAAWLGSSEAQGIVGAYGKDWNHGKALFTLGNEDEFDQQDLLVRLHM